MQIEPHKDKIIDMYCSQGMNSVQIANIIGCSSSGVGRLLIRNGIELIHTPNELRMLRRETTDIIQMYLDGLTTKEIGRRFGVCDASISKVLRENNIPIRAAKRRSPVKYHDYFESIDSIDKAYFLGWLISDGCIIENRSRTGRAKTISLEINSNDIEILYLFANVIGANTSIIKHYNKRNHSYIRFASDKMATDLEKYGVVARKSHIAYLPQLPDELMPHLIRGIFDGDGTVTIDKTAQIHVGFYGSETICNQITEYLSKSLSLRRNKVSKSTCFHVWYGGNNISRKIMDFLYCDCGRYYLRRKKTVFDKVL